LVVPHALHFAVLRGDSTMHISHRHVVGRSLFDHRLLLLPLSMVMLCIVVMMDVVVVA